MATPAEMTATMIANLKAKTGKSLGAWLKLTRASKLEKHGQLVKLLKEEHGVTHGFANLIAHCSLNPTNGQPSESELVDAQYVGKKADLRPIYEALVELVRGLGKDVELVPKKAYVSLRRKRQFGLIQPSTATRIDLGLNLKGEPATTRLEASGSFNAMVSHRVRIGAPSDLDAELKAWLKKAYAAS